jgi:hypothetical protein
MSQDRLNPLNDYIFLKVMARRKTRNSYAPSSTLFWGGRDRMPLSRLR